MASEYELVRVNAFGSGLGEGNPCAVVLDAGDLPAATMQRIAHDLGLSETAFVLRCEGTKAAARYFTPREEIPLAGHPTLAVGRALAESGRLEARRGMTLQLALQAGEVEVEIVDRGTVTEVTMAQCRPIFGHTFDAEAVGAFGLGAEDLLPGAEIQVISTGTPQLMVPLRDLETLRRAKIQEAPYARLYENGGFFSAHLFCLEGFTERGTTAARHLAVSIGVPEDPFTGSATGGMAAYLWHHGLIDEPTFVAEQGHAMDRPGWARVEVVGPRNDIETVRVGGNAVTVVRGRIRVPQAT